MIRCSKRLTSVVHASAVFWVNLRREIHIVASLGRADSGGEGAVTVPIPVNSKPGQGRACGGIAGGWVAWIVRVDYQRSWGKAVGNAVAGSFVLPMPLSCAMRHEHGRKRP